MSTPTRIIFNLGGRVRVSPLLWPDKRPQVQPGDLTKFAPHGNGVYGYQEQFDSNPLTSAPPQEASGGVVYFGSRIAKADFQALLRILEVDVKSKDYAVFVAESEKPGKDGFIAQMRIVSKFALRFMFDVLAERDYESFPQQQLTVGEALEAFVEHEARRWGTDWMEDRGLYGKFGGDGDYACEELAFGFMQENEYHHICRIWSRAWLVTK